MTPELIDYNNKDHHQKEWGQEIWLVNTELYCGKVLIVNPMSRCSMHYHEKKDETFVVDAGRVFLEYYEEGTHDIILLEQSMRIRIRPGVYHRFWSMEVSTVYEFSTHHEEEDSYRMLDKLSGTFTLEQLNQVITECENETKE